MSGPKETAYDAKISPLMTQVIALCQQARIPMAATFELDAVEGESDPLWCTTVLQGEGFDSCSNKISRVASAMYPEEPSPLVVKTFDGDGELTNYTVIA